MARTAFSCRQAGRVLSMGERAVSARVKAGDLPGYRMGNRLMVPRPALAQFVGGETILAGMEAAAGLEDGEEEEEDGEDEPQPETPSAAAAAAVNLLLAVGRQQERVRQSLQQQERVLQALLPSPAEQAWRQSLQQQERVWQSLRKTAELFAAATRATKVFTVAFAALPALPSLPRLDVQFGAVQFTAEDVGAEEVPAVLAAVLPFSGIAEERWPAVAEEAARQLQAVGAVRIAA